MDALDAHTAAAVEIERKAALLEAGKLDAPTPCEGWSVRDLLQHVVSGNVMSTKLVVDRISKEEAIALRDVDVLGDDPVGALKRTNKEMDAAFRSADLNMTVDHPALTMPVAQLVMFRTADLLAHAWDLASAIGIDDTLDQDVVAHLFAQLEPLGPILAGSGQFGEGPSGTLPDDAPLQTRFLDVIGRRP
jgi:uncharacterized protein (TIGR03086 family)